MGLHLAQLVPFDDLEVLDAVGVAALEEVLQVLLLLRAARDDQRARELVAKVKVFVEAREHLVALPAQPRAVGARRVVESSMHDARIALGRALANVITSLEHDDRRRRLGELARDSGTDAACADDGDLTRPGDRASNQSSRFNSGADGRGAPMLGQRGRSSARYTHRMSRRTLRLCAVYAIAGTESSPRSRWSRQGC